MCAFIFFFKNILLRHLKKLSPSKIQKASLQEEGGRSGILTQYQYQS